jgi:hypothetical protein
VSTLAALEAAGTTPDLTIGSPCLFCLHTFGKTTSVMASA